MKKKEQDQNKQAIEKLVETGWEETQVPGVYILIELDQDLQGWKVDEDKLKASIIEVLGKDAAKKLKFLDKRHG